MKNPRVLQIEPFTPEQAGEFERLNRAWLVEYGLLEPADETQLADPVGEIVGVGGWIFVAKLGLEVVGTAAVLPHGERVMELVKLAVAPAAQGRGAGRRLVEACIEYAKRQGAVRLVLVSSSRLGAALGLYQRLGFQHHPMPEWVPYLTADVYMELELSQSPVT